MEEVELEGSKPENSESLLLQSLLSSHSHGWWGVGGVMRVHVMCLLFCNPNVSLFGTKFVYRYSYSFIFSFDSCSGCTVNPD